jgi:hypothetical protein
MRTSFQIFDLNDFNAFMMKDGWVSEPTVGEYEVARYKKKNEIGGDVPVLVYRKKNGTMTVWPNGWDIEYLLDAPHRFEHKSPRVIRIEAGEAATSPASAEDVPW